MYSDKKRRRGPLVWLLCAALAAIIALGVRLSPSDEVKAEGAEATGDAVRRCALQCYAVEGVYPPDLEYMEENYGLAINRRDYYVTYQAFSSNLPPTVRVTLR